MISIIQHIIHRDLTRTSSVVGRFQYNNAKRTYEIVGCRHRFLGQTFKSVEDVKKAQKTELLNLKKVVRERAQGSPINTAYEIVGC